MGCPKVQAKIEEAMELRDAGACWCPCVNDDIPKAEELLADGQCGSANSVISAALRRCDRKPRMPKLHPVKIPVITPVKLGR